MIPAKIMVHYFPICLAVSIYWYSPVHDVCW